MMTRLLIRLAPIALFSYPVFVLYQGHQRMGDAFEWREHTYEAKSLAERLGRLAGCAADPAGLAIDLEKFAKLTADNPRQVANAEAIRAALSPLDHGKLCGLVDSAIREEDRLLGPRRVRAAEEFRETGRLAGTVLLIGGVIFVIQAVLDFFYRATKPPGGA